MAKLDDFLQKKKESTPILDLSRTTASSKEEFRRILDKVPDFKIKQEKVKLEEIRIREKRFTFKTGKKDYKAMKVPYTFMDPLPLEMKNLSIRDLASVSIDWRMLTTVRPKSKVDEDFFSRLIELRKSEMKTEARDKREVAMDPQIRKPKNKAGVVEMRVVSCSECGEDFCNGTACRQFGYETCSRLPELPLKPVLKPSTSNDKDVKKKKKILKKKSHSTSRRKARSKSKSPKKESSKNI